MKRANLPHPTVVICLIKKYKTLQIDKTFKAEEENIL